MATPAQIEANRRNARRSTGPRTPAGKARSSRNALKHGLRAASPALPPPLQQPFAAFLASLLDSLAPASPAARTAASQLARASWNLLQLSRHEARLLTATPPEKLPATLSYLARLQTKADRALYDAATAYERTQSQPAYPEPQPETEQTNPIPAPAPTAKRPTTTKRTQFPTSPHARRAKNYQTKPICRPRTRPQPPATEQTNPIPRPRGPGHPCSNSG